MLAVWSILLCAWGASPVPEDARVHLQDVERFYEVFHTRQERGFVRRLRRDYLRAGSPGLKRFRSRIGSARALAREVRASESYYARLEGELKRVPAMQGRFEEVFAELEGRYPDAVYPDVYILVGRFMSGGTISDEGLLIGGELYGLTDEVDVEGLPTWLRDGMKSVEELDAIVAHELVHYQQSYASWDRLAHVLNEGSADYIGEVLSGRHINDAAHAYGREHDAELKAKFCPTRHLDGAGPWLYRMSSDSDVPKDLGYYVGYRISEEYMARAADPSQALIDLMLVEDAEALLQASGYCGSESTAPQVD